MEELKAESNETYVNRETKETLTDLLDISYYKNLQEEEIVDNLLLGEFDKTGAYSIKKDYLLELIAVPKYIKELSDSRYILYAKAKIADLKFALQIQDEPDNKKSAVLKFIEIALKASGERETLKTVVARYKDDNDVYFMTKVKKIFNIVEGTEGKEIDNEEFLELILRKWQNFNLLKKQENRFNDLYKEYIEKILMILKENPGVFSEYILRQYGKIVLSMEAMINSANYYKELKIKLDKIINQAKNKVKEEKIFELINKARQEYLDSHKKIQEEILVVKPIMAKPALSKEKAAGKAKGGGPKPSKPVGKKKIEEKKVKAKEAAKPSYPAFEPQASATKSENKNIDEKVKASLSQNRSLFNILNHNTTSLVEKITSEEILNRTSGGSINKLVENETSITTGKNKEQIL